MRAASRRANHRTRGEGAKRVDVRTGRPWVPQESSALPSRFDSTLASSDPGPRAQIRHALSLMSAPESAYNPSEEPQTEIAPGATPPEAPEALRESEAP